MSAGRNCPFCGGKKPTQDNNLSIKNPKLAKEWHPTKHGSLTADRILPRSNKKVWWKCKKGHEWQVSIGNRYNGTGCPDCAGKKLSAHHNIAVKYPDLISQWDNVKKYTTIPFSAPAPLIA